MAVAVGTAHGKYKSTPKLDINRLDQIRKKVDVPLVLHGASGLNDNQIRSCIKNGICKINIATELRCIWTQAITKAMQRHRIFMIQRMRVGRQERQLRN